MKSIILPAALLCSFAALAQAPVASVKHVYKYAANERKQEAKIDQHDQEDNDREADKADAPANHGQTVQAVATGTPLTGADKGMAVSTLASNGHAAARRDHSHGARSEHSARGEHSHSQNTHHSGQQSGGHYGGH